MLAEKVASDAFLTGTRLKVTSARDKTSLDTLITVMAASVYTNMVFAFSGAPVAAASEVGKINRSGSFLGWFWEASDAGAEPDIVVVRSAASMAG